MEQNKKLGIVFQQLDPLERYRLYVASTIGRGSVPMEFQKWKQTIDEITRDFIEYLKGIKWIC